MKFILGGVNGSFLRDLLEGAEYETNGHRRTERVDAAVAYAADGDLLFEWCWQRGIPLRYWGRFDETVPVSVPILERFLNRRSPNFTCRLVRLFHPKVIWWRGFGAYIGSANLTQSAWWKNFEAGVFLSEEELAEEGKDLELQSLFDQIDSAASPLTEELFRSIKYRSVALEMMRRQNIRDAQLFENIDLVEGFEGLSRISSRNAGDRRRQIFLAEWHSTIQIIRDLGKRVSGEGNRPVWIAESAPWGVQADQFLQAHYYSRTFDGARANYEEHFRVAKANPEKVVQEAVEWWKGQPKAPNNEDRTINEWAPYLVDVLSERNILSMSEETLIATLSRIHASLDYARRVPNKVVGLPGDRTYNMEEKVAALARHIFRKPSIGAPSPLETWNYVLYGGRTDELPSRMWDALNDPKLRVENFGISALGELVGWAMPDIFPPRNGRTSKALRSLGYDVRVYVG